MPKGARLKNPPKVVCNYLVGLRLVIGLYSLLYYYILKKTPQFQFNKLINTFSLNIDNTLYLKIVTWKLWHQAHLINNYSKSEKISKNPFLINSMFVWHWYEKTEELVHHCYFTLSIQNL